MRKEVCGTHKGKAPLEEKRCEAKEDDKRLDHWGRDNHGEERGGLRSWAGMCANQCCRLRRRWGGLNPTLGSQVRARPPIVIKKGLGSAFGLIIARSKQLRRVTIMSQKNLR